jgi:putative flippase GtrA
VLNPGQIARFLLVGFTGVAIDGLFYWILSASTDQIALAKATGYLAGAVFAYFANWRFTFKSERSSNSVVLFIAVYTTSLLINVTGNGFGLTVVPSESNWHFAVFIGITGITTVWNYLGMSLFVFRGKGKPADGKS